MSPAADTSPPSESSSGGVANEFAKELTEAPTVGDQSIQDARGLVTALLRTMKTLHLYNAKNPVHKKALKDIGERFRTYIVDNGPLHLTIAGDSICLGNQPVHTDDNPRDGLAFRLYSDGVRAISFADGLSDEEARRAVTVFAAGTSMSSADDDMVTLFWNADLPHVTLDVIEDDAPVGELNPTQEDLPPVTTEQLVAAVELDTETTTAPTVELGADVLGVFHLTAEEHGYLEKLIRWEETVDPVEDLVGILLDVLSIEDDDDEFDEMIEAYAGLLRDFLSQGSFETTIRQVRALREMNTSRENMSDRMKAAVLQVWKNLGTGENLEALNSGIHAVFGEQDDTDMGRLDQVREQDLTLLKTYVGLLHAVDPIALLGVAANTRIIAVRDCLCDQVAQVSDSRRSELFTALHNSDAGLVQCALRVVHQIGQSSDLPELSALANHADARVRRGALEAIIHITNGAHEAVLPYLSDQEAPLRRRALGAVTSANYRGALPPLQALIASDDFSEWELNERRAVFAAAGQLGGDDMMSFFDSHLKRRRILFGGKKNEDMSLCAVAGLRAVGTEAARKSLAAAERHRNQRIRAAATAALRELESPT